MKSAYYLAPAEHLGRFEKLFEQEGVFASPFAIEQLPSLTAFVSRDKVIAQQNYVILDVGKVENWSIPHILSAVQYLRRLSSAQLIFIGEDCPDVTELFGVLATHHHVNHLVTERAGMDLNSELRNCFADTPKLADKMQIVNTMLAQQAAAVVKPLDIPPGLVIEVAVAGTMPRCGTTTQTFAVYHYLKSLGWHPAIWDKFNRDLPVLTQYEEYERTEEDVIRIRGVDFVTRQMPQFDAYIIDYGVLTPETAPLFVRSDMSVLVGCTKPWELPAFAEAIKMLFGHPTDRTVTLGSFSTPEELDKLAKHLGDNRAVAPYNPDLWHLSSGKTYANLMLPTLKEICGMSPDIEPEVEEWH